jgi:hypothetical protein
MYVIYAKLIGENKFMPVNCKATKVTKRLLRATWFNDITEAKEALSQLIELTGDFIKYDIRKKELKI